MSEKIGDMQTKITEFQDEIQKIINILINISTNNGEKLRIDLVVPGTEHSTADSFARLFAAIKAIQNWFPDEDGALLYEKIVVDIINLLDQVEESIKTVIENIDHTITKNGGIDHIDYQRFHFRMSNGSDHDFRPIFAPIQKNIDRLVNYYLDHINILGAKVEYSVAAASSQLQSYIDQIRKNIESLEEKTREVINLSNNVNEMRNNISSIVKNASNTIAEMERQLDQSESDRRSIAEYLADSNTNRSAMAEIVNEARKLSSQVVEYASEFESYKDVLDRRNAVIEKGNKDVETIVSTNQEFRKEIKETIDKSKNMLSAATVSGLASNFSTIKDELTSELKKSIMMFYFGILFLVVMSFPLFIFIAQDLFVDFVSTRIHPDSLSGWEYVVQLLGRFVLLVPPAWLISFSVNRHRVLLNLREHYAYKYSMAVSVEGFKKQADQYEQEIAALVFENLSYNPAATIYGAPEKDGERTSHIRELLINKLQERFTKIDNK